VLLVFLKYAHQAKSGTAKLANVKRDVLRLWIASLLKYGVL
jgi:hypothetical protein